MGQSRFASFFLGLNDPNSDLFFPFFLVHLNVFSYAFSYWVTQPLLPFLSKELGADGLIFGYLTSLFSLMQIVGGGLVGRVVDTRTKFFGGTKTALLLTLFGTALSHILLGSAGGLVGLFLSRLPTCLMALMQVAQSYISKVAGGRDGVLLTQLE